METIRMSNPHMLHSPQPASSLKYLDHQLAPVSTISSLINVTAPPTQSSPFREVRQEWTAPLKRKRSPDQSQEDERGSITKRPMLSLSPPKGFVSPTAKKSNLSREHRSPWEPTIPKSVPSPTEGKIQLPPIRSQALLEGRSSPTDPKNSSPRQRGYLDSRAYQRHSAGAEPSPKLQSGIKLPPINTIGIMSNEPIQRTPDSHALHLIRPPHAPQSTSHGSLGSHDGQRSSTSGSPSDMSRSTLSQSRYTTPRSSVADLSPRYLGHPSAGVSIPPRTSSSHIWSQHDNTAPAPRISSAPATAAGMEHTVPPCSHTLTNGFERSAAVRVDGISSVPQIPYKPQDSGDRYGWNEVPLLDEPSPRRRRGNLPKESTAVLNDWFGQHLSHPYPTEEEKQHFQTKTGLTMSQISNWFINARRRRLTNRATE